MDLRFCVYSIECGIEHYPCLKRVAGTVSGCDSTNGFVSLF